MRLDFPVEYLGKKEYDAWRRLCQALHKCGAVTREDLNARLGDRSTEGCRLLTMIRAWGDDLVALVAATSENRNPLSPPPPDPR